MNSIMYSYVENGWILYFQMFFFYENSIFLQTIVTIASTISFNLFAMSKFAVWLHKLFPEID